MTREKITLSQLESFLFKAADSAGKKGGEFYTPAEVVRLLVQSIEALWDKYAVSLRTLEAQRAETLGKLDGFLEKLGYLK
jgi:type I restriction enzyme M protein